jgi:hypothetical protein
LQCVVGVAHFERLVLRLEPLTLGPDLLALTVVALILNARALQLFDDLFTVIKLILNVLILVLELFYLVLVHVLSFFKFQQTLN